MATTIDEHAEHQRRRHGWEAQRQQRCAERFHQNCLRLQRNDPEFQGFEIPVDLRDDQAKQLARSMTGNTSLRMLVMFVGTTLTPDGAQELAESIRRLYQLKRFLLILEGGNSMVNPQVWKLLFQAIHRSRTIQGLYVGLSKGHADQSAEHMLHTLMGSSCEERKLAIHMQDTFTIDSAQILADGIRTLRLSELRLFGQMTNLAANLNTMRVLFQGVEQSTTIQRLDISNQWGGGRLGPDEMRVISLGIQKSNSVFVSLHLTNNHITDDGVAAFLEHWRPTSPIRELHIGENAIGPAGARMLIQAAVAHSDLKTLNLHNNKMIGYEGLARLAQEFPRLTQLRELTISSCIGMEAGASNRRRTQASRHKAEQSLIRGIRANRQIRKIILQGNGFSQQVIDEVKFYTDLNENGRYLLALEPNTLLQGVWPRVMANCGNHPNSIFFFLIEQPHIVRY